MRQTPSIMDTPSIYRIHLRSGKLKHTVKISTASASVWPLTALPLLPHNICQPKVGLLDSAFSLAAPCCCRLSNNSLIMLSESDSGPFATNCFKISSMSWQSFWQNHSPSGNSCQVNQHNPHYISVCSKSRTNKSYKKYLAAKWHQWMNNSSTRIHHAWKGNTSNQ